MQHPWAVAPLFSQPNPGLGAVRIGEFALGILRRAGFTNTQAVAAFSGLETMRAAYAHAVETGYRFFSYGDANLLFKASHDAVAGEIRDLLPRARDT